MSYYFNKKLKGKNFEEVIEQVVAELKKEGFGVLTEIDIKSTLKKKLGINFRKYKILGACNPHFAHQALEKEDKIGLFLPCNVIVEESKNGTIEVSIVDPIASMLSIKNKALGDIAVKIRLKLQSVIDHLV